MHDILRLRALLPCAGQKFFPHGRARLFRTFGAQVFARGQRQQIFNLRIAGAHGEQAGFSVRFVYSRHVLEGKIAAPLFADLRKEMAQIIPQVLHRRLGQLVGKEYKISLSESGELTMKFQTSKSWTDYIGTKPAAEYRKIKLSVPGELLSGLTIKTTNEAIDVAPLSVSGEVSLDSNGGDLNFEKIDVGESLTVTAKNGNITGSVLGSWDDFSITCEYKKGECNLPESKEGGTKSLKANCNNGDIAIQFVTE